MYSQFSDVRFSSVAFATTSQLQWSSGRSYTVAELTNGIIERILLRAKHCEMRLVRAMFLQRFNNTLML